MGGKRRGKEREIAPNVAVAWIKEGLAKTDSPLLQAIIEKCINEANEPDPDVVAALIKKGHAETGSALLKTIIEKCINEDDKPHSNVAIALIKEGHAKRDPALLETIIEKCIIKAGKPNSHVAIALINQGFLNDGGVAFKLADGTTPLKHIINQFICIGNPDSRVAAALINQGYAEKDQVLLQAIINNFIDTNYPNPNVAVALINQGLLKDGAVAFDPEYRQEILTTISKKFITQATKPNPHVAEALINQGYAVLYPFVAVALIDAGLVEEGSELFTNIAEAFKVPADQRTLEGLTEYIKGLVSDLASKPALSPEEWIAKNGLNPDAAPFAPSLVGSFGYSGLPVYLPTVLSGNGLGKGKGNVMNKDAAIALIKSGRAEKDQVLLQAIINQFIYTNPNPDVAIALIQKLHSERYSALLETIIEKCINAKQDPNPHVAAVLIKEGHAGRDQALLQTIIEKCIFTTLDKFVAAALINQGLLKDEGVEFKLADGTTPLQHIINEFIYTNPNPNVAQALINQGYAVLYPFVAVALIDAGLVTEGSELFTNIAEAFKVPADQPTLEGLTGRIKELLSQTDKTRKPAQLDTGSVELPPAGVASDGRSFIPTPDPWEATDEEHSRWLQDTRPQEEAGIGLLHQPQPVNAMGMPLSCSQVISSDQSSSARMDESSFPWVSRSSVLTPAVVQTPNLF